MVLRSRLTAFGVLAAIGCGGAPAEAPPPPVEAQDPVFPYPLDDLLRFEHLQAKSTHNSYHVEPTGNLVPDWAYTHAPLDEQLDAQGVRHVELDLRRSSEGFFEVYHLTVLDEETTCRRFTDCLGSMKAWSDAHRAHHPLVVQLELKDAHPGDAAIEEYFAVLHAEIESVWPPKRLVLPDDVRGASASLGEAVASRGWPTLGSLRGRLMFTLDDRGAFRDSYTRKGAGLDGRILFPHSEPGDAFAAVAVINDPIAGADAIAAALAANMLVRTRADSDGVEPAAGDTARRDAALASGAHFVTTDYPAPVEGVDYWVEIPGGTPSRCNPVIAPPECTSEAIEDPAFFAP